MNVILRTTFILIMMMLAIIISTSCSKQNGESAVQTNSMQQNEGSCSKLTLQSIETLKVSNNKGISMNSTNVSQKSIVAENVSWLTITDSARKELNNLSATPNESGNILTIAITGYG